MEFEQAIDESRARITELAVACHRTEQQADELTGSARKAWQRRVELLRNRNIAAQAADLMDG